MRVKFSQLLSMFGIVQALWLVAQYTGKTVTCEGGGRWAILLTFTICDTCQPQPRYMALQEGTDFLLS